MRASKKFEDYDYKNDPIFLDIPLFSAGQTNIGYDLTPNVVIDSIFQRFNEIICMLDLKMELWRFQ